MTPFTIDLSPIIRLTDDQFEMLCAANPDTKFERTSTGKLVIMSPTGGETGMNNATLISRFVVWNEQTNLGKVFDHTHLFHLCSHLERLLLQHFNDIVLLMAIDYFDQSPSFNIPDNGSEVLVSFAPADFIDAHPFNSFPPRVFF